MMVLQVTVQYNGLRNKNQYKYHRIHEVLAFMMYIVSVSMHFILQESNFQNFN